MRLLRWIPVVIGCAAVLAGHSSTPSRRMAVTIDDLPVSLSSRHTIAQQESITADLLATLARHEVPAVGFVNESRLETDGTVDPRKVDLLGSWLDAGLELGNHSYSHPDLHRVSVDEWLADVAKGERILRPLVETRGRTLRYFRHPFLHTGRSAETQRTVEDWLTARAYTIAPVTIDNSEWIYGRAYADPFNRQDESLKERIAASYIDYMCDVVDYYEQQAERIVRRPIPHILLIHAYALNADHLGSLLTRLENAGWRWITLEDALEDAAYQRQSHGYTGGGGITWLHRWAITAGMDRSIFEGEPTVPDWIRELG